MADFEGFEDRTEEPTQHRRDELKKDGQISQSKELGGALLLLVSTGALYASTRWSIRGLFVLFHDLFSDMNRIVARDWSPEYIGNVARHIFTAVLYILAPVMLTALVISVLASFMQTGFVWTTKPLEPDLERVNPLSGLKRIFSPESLFEMFKAFFKLTVVGSLLYFAVKKRVIETSNIWSLEASGLAVVFGQHLFHILFLIGFSMFVLAMIDFGFQKFRYEQKIRMTKQEAKEERREQDGNPQIKARIRSVQRQIASRKMMDAVRTADVVITNPTHIAVALIYDRENMFAPKVVAKGADFMAEQIKRIAREAGVPCVENVPLARAMFKALKIGQFISRDLYNAVAEVLAYVYRLKGRNL